MGEEPGLAIPRPRDWSEGRDQVGEEQRLDLPIPRDRLKGGGQVGEEPGLAIARSRDRSEGGDQVYESENSRGGGIHMMDYTELPDQVQMLIS